MGKLPTTPDELIAWTWPEIEPLYAELEARALSAETVEAWLLDWSQLAEHLSELYSRLYVATTVNTADEQAERRLKNFFDTIFPGMQAAEQRLKQKFLESGLEPEGFAVPLRNLHAEAALFREANLPLLAEEQKLNTEYDKLLGAQTVPWEDGERTVAQMRALLVENDRALRERAWRAMTARQLADRPAIDALWTRLLELRRQVAANAGQPDYRAFQWRRLHRFDYTPEDCKAFHRAIEEVVVPAAARIYDRHRRQMGLDRLRPWDVDADPLGRPPLRPFQNHQQLQDGVRRILHEVDPGLGRNFEIMQVEGLLDLDNRKHKAPGGYCINFDVVRRPFIFMNAVGLHADVSTLLHESGHAFHVFESAGIRFAQQMFIPMEFSEVASMAMEMLALPHLEASGLYTRAEAARAGIELLESSIQFWPYMAVVDAFQHEVYENPARAADPRECDRIWSDLWDRFMVGVDFTGLEEIKSSRWQFQLHVIQSPFYYIEYGLAQLGAVQIWANARRDPAAAVRAYRQALSLGGKVPLPELFSAAGARFAFDAETLRAAVDLCEQAIAELEQRT